MRKKEEVTNHEFFPNLDLEEAVEFVVILLNVGELLM